MESAAEQTTEWERHKAQERSERQSGAGASCLDGIALALPALTRAEKLQKRAAGVGFDWPSINGVIAKIGEEVREVEAVLGESRDSERLMDEVGDLLFSCVNLARHVGVDAETSLRGASHKFERRFREMETRLTTQGASVSTAAASRLDEIWEEIKKETG